MYTIVNHKTAWTALAVVALLALVAIVWATSTISYPVAVNSAQTGTTAAGTGATAGTGAGAGNGAGQAAGTSNTGAGSTASAPNRDVSIKITGFSAGNPSVIPSMDYTLTGNVAGDFVSIVGKQGGEVVYIAEQPVDGGNTYTLNLRELKRGDGSTTAVGAGEYFVRISDHNGKILTQSGFFMVRAGKGELQ